MSGSMVRPRWLFAFALPLLMVDVGWAGDGCHRCGGNSPCRKTVQWVKEDKKLSYTCWGLEDEDFCIGAPSCLKCEQGQTVCQEGCVEANAKSNPKVRSGPSYWAWKIWQPASTAKVYTRQKLMKKTMTKTVPSFKWVVVDLCEACRITTGDDDAAPKKIATDG
jgi:hypothetical protein